MGLRNTAQPDRRLGLLRLMREVHEAMTSTLRRFTTQNHAAYPMNMVVLEYGIGLRTCSAQWCAGVESKLTGRNV